MSEVMHVEQLFNSKYQKMMIRLVIFGMDHRVD